MSRNNQRITYWHNDEERVAPHKWAICGQCDGHGKSSAYLGAYTRDDMDEQGPDFEDDYMSGRYDRACECCDGSGKVMVADYTRMKPEEIAAHKEDLADDAEYDAMVEAERRYGC